MENELVTFYSPKSAVSEMFRTLRTNIQFMTTNNNIRLLLITSSMPGEGKSWVTANLAVAFAQSGKKVLVIDSDMRRGRQASIFKKMSDPGLSNIISELNYDGSEYTEGIDGVIQETVVKNLFLISAGAVPPNPSELLVSEKTRELIQELKQKFDLIILDGTPCSIVTDSVILSKDADATLIVTAYKKTKAEDLKRIKKEIENVGGKVIGVTLNRINTIEKRYQNGYYYYSNNTEITPKKNK